MILNVLTRGCDLNRDRLNQQSARESSVKSARTCMGNYQLLCHINPCHVSARSNKFTEGIAVSARAAAEVQHSAALELCWERKTTTEESGETLQG